MSVAQKLYHWFERILKKICIWFLHLFHKDLTEKQWNQFMQFVKFGMVGLSNTIINYVCYLILIKLGVYYLIASIVGFLVSVVNAYYWNSKYVFRKEGEKQSHLQAFIKVFLSYAATGLVLNNILLFIWVNLLHLSEVIGPIVTLIVTIPTNFILNKLWAFRSGKK